MASVTLFVAGSILLIALSAIALVVGWLNANESWIWTSIGATAGAAVLLVLAYFRSGRVPVVATQPADEAAAPEETQALEATPSVPPAPPGEGTLTAESAPAARVEAQATTAAAVADVAGDVVAVPRTKKFHRSDCRFAGAQGAETMGRAEAEGAGYTPCGVCHP